MTTTAPWAADEGGREAPFSHPHVHEQAEPARAWRVSHGLPGFPGVRVWLGPRGDRAAATPAAVVYLGAGLLEVRFDREVAGAAVLRP